MFRSAVNDTPFLGQTPDSVFSRVDGDEFRGDHSFVATLRALVFPRMDEQAPLRFRYREIALSKNDVERNNPDVIMSHILSVSKGNAPPENTIRLYNMCGHNADGNTAALDVVEKHFLRFIGGSFTRIERFTEFFRNAFRVLCYIDRTAKTTLVFADNVDLRKFHFLQVAIPVMLPWYFPPEAGMSQQEITLIESLKEKTPDRYLTAMAAAAERYDFRSMKIRNELGNFENRFLEREAEGVQNLLDRYMSSVQSYENEIAGLMRQYYDANIKLMGLRAKIAEGDGTSEIVSYFIRNKNLSLVCVDRSRLTFNCKGYLTYFDEEGVKRYLNNKNSVFYQTGGRISDSDIALLMKALFLDQRLRMKFCAQYTFDLSGSVTAASGANYGSEFGDCTPNPHTDRFSCLGNYERAINERLRGHDYIGAIEQCIGSCVSLNFADGTVIGEFMRRICGVSGRRVNIHCIELPDGTVVEPMAAIQWLKEQDGQKETQETAEAAVEETNE